MKTYELKSDPLASIIALAVMLVALILIGVLGGCASAPEIQILSASCDVEHTDEIAVAVRCDLDMLVDDERASAMIETTLEEEPADRCVLGEVRYSTWVLGGLFAHPISAEECEEKHALFGFGAADRPLD